MTNPLPTLERVSNFRDVGRTINDYLGERRLREGLFFRSARLNDATASDRQLIRDEIGVRAVIDLRTQSEHIKQARIHQARVAKSQTHPEAATVQPLRIKGLEYHEVKITGRPFEKHLLAQLTWWSYFKFLFLYLTGFRMQAISILGREVMEPRGLLGLGLDTLDQSGDQMREALALYTSQATLPSVVHCTHGKDRTGLVCAIILMILDVPIDAIEHDYFLTDAGLQHERDKRVREIREIGLPDHWAGTEKTMIVGIRDHLDAQYGGLDTYLDRIGFTKADRTLMRDTLLY